MTLRRRPDPGPSQILVVCTGNLCRSPLAEALLVAALPGSVQVRSAGTLALVGEPVEPGAARELRRRGLDPTGLRATELTAPLVHDAALVLTAEREHRAAAVRLDPSAAARTFTFGEIARLLEGVPVEPLDPAGLAALAAGRRGRVRAAVGDEDDLPDPYGGSRTDFARCATALERLLASPIAFLGAGSLDPAGTTERTDRTAGSAD